MLQCSSSLRDWGLRDLYWSCNRTTWQDTGVQATKHYLGFKYTPPAIIRRQWTGPVAFDCHSCPLGGPFSSAKTFTLAFVSFTSKTTVLTLWNHFLLELHQHIKRRKTNLKATAGNWEQMSLQPQVSLEKTGSFMLSVIKSKLWSGSEVCICFSAQFPVYYLTSWMAKSHPLTWPLFTIFYGSHLNGRLVIFTEAVGGWGWLNSYQLTNIKRENIR